MAELAVNGGQSTLATAPSGTTGTSLAIQTADEAKFPATGNFACLLQDSLTSPTQYEIVEVTAVSGATFTITRASEPYAGSQTAQTWSAGAYITQVATVGTAAKFITAEFPITAFGASTSLADNLAAINAALTAAGVSGGRVVVPPGTFVSSPFTISNPNVALKLMAGATLQLKAGVNPTAFITVTASWCAIFGEGTIDGNAANNTSGYGVYINASAASQSLVGSHVRGVTVQHTANTAIRYEPTGTSATVTNCAVSGCTVQNTGTGSSVAEGIMFWGASNCIAEGNFVSNTANHGIVSTEGNANIIRGNQISNVGTGYSSGSAHGITIDGNGGSNPNSGHVISGNRVQNCYMDGIEVADAVDDVAITGNNVSNVGTGASAGAQKDGIYFGGGLAGGNRATITGNIVETAAGYGIHLDAPSSTTRSSKPIVTGNVVRDCQFAGIYVNNTDDYIIVGNTVVDNSLAGVGSYGGIQMGTSAGPGQVQVNRVYGANHLYNIYFAAAPTNTVLASNNWIGPPYDTGAINTPTGVVTTAGNVT